MKQYPSLIAAVLIIVVAVAVATSYDLITPPRGLAADLPYLGKAPEIQGISGWINSEALSLEGQEGKVVLVDFWTYSCINCIRTLPYLKDWHDKYSDQGLVIIGIHTPEFNFERDYSNVQQAVLNHEIEYAVALDNDYTTWRAYRNNYWPRKYLVDSEGNLRYDHIGEGGYEETENAIIQLLGEITDVDEKESNVSSDPSLGRATFGITGEVYVGYRRGRIGNMEGYSPGQTVEYQDSGSHNQGLVYFDGAWNNQAEYMELSGEGYLSIKYSGSVVNLVFSSESGAVAEITVDGRPLSEKELGSNAFILDGKSMVRIDEPDMYNLIGPGLEPGEHEVRISSSDRFKAYAFTFAV